MAKYLITENTDYFTSLGWTSFIDVWSALEALDGHDFISADLETTGLGSALYEKINALTLGTPTDQYVVDVHTVDIQKFKKLLESKTLIGHNLKFDIPYLYWADIRPSCIVDSMVYEDQLTKGLEFRPDRAKDLLSCLKRHLGVDIDKSLQKDINKGLISLEAIEYSATDVEHLFALKDKQIEKLEKLDLKVRADFECAFILDMCYWEYSGVRVDPDRLYEWCREIEADEVIAERKLKELQDINWSSTKEVGEVLKQYGIEEYNEDTGNSMTGAEILKKHDIPIAKLLLEHRTMAKMVSTYGRKWFHFILSDGRIHTRYNHSVETGRPSSGDVSRKKFNPLDSSYVCDKPFPNLMNIVGNNKFRRIFIPGSRNVFVDCDYSSQESVILADQSEDPKMLEFFKSGSGDMHSYVSRLVYPELRGLSDEEIQTDHKDKRTLIKTASFAIAYGGNGITIANNINCPIEVGNAVYEEYMSVFSGLKEYFDKCYNFAWQQGYMPMDNLTGGKRFFDRAKEYYDIKTDSKMWNRYTAEKSKDSMWYRNKKNELRWYFHLTSTLRRESVNTLMQGTAATMSKLAVMYFMRWVRDNGMWGKVLVPFFVYDQILAECNKKSADKVAEALQWSMQLAGKKCLKQLEISAVPKICMEYSK